MVEEEKIESTPEEVEVKPVPVEEEPKEEVKAEAEPFPTKILVATIMAVVGAGFAVSWSFTAFFAVAFGIVAIVLANTAAPTTKRPWNVFHKVARIVGIVEIPVGALMGTIWTIVKIVEVASKAIESAGA